MVSMMMGLNSDVSLSWSNLSSVLDPLILSNSPNVHPHNVNNLIAVFSKSISAKFRISVVISYPNKDKNIV